jgi:hypothetical protein
VLFYTEFMSFFSWRMSWLTFFNLFFKKFNLIWFLY